MAPARRKRVLTRQGTRDFVLKALEETRRGRAVATMAIIRQVRKLSGKRIPEETIRSSLKTLVRQRLVKGRKNGNEKFYKLVAAPSAAGAATSSAETPPPERVPLNELFERHAKEPRHAVGWIDPKTERFRNIIVGEPTLPHKLAIGEVLILEIGLAHVETATNVHGKVVLERHTRPK
ncbi:MAG: hypothetical protein KGJ23_12640 [Euryarchaeota archaeon]|nr:hypothetical protein [Euryarchaeota archaeon]MDE1837446.1 hypothetical protein [Euryarchaeota archaeon]MDE1882009.1 hypothetical protein [Euryarchaeota archaeon]MDE2045588.1 hypothetical protein [Thermoplasmata archaeon]